MHPEGPHRENHCSGDAFCAELWQKCCKFLPSAGFRGAAVGPRSAVHSRIKSPNHSLDGGWTKTPQTDVDLATVPLLFLYQHRTAVMEVDIGKHRNESDVHFFRKLFPHGKALAVETVPPLAEQLLASELPGLEVVNVNLDAVDDPEPREVVLEFPPVVRGLTVREASLRSCCEENARHPHFVQLHNKGVRTYCAYVCGWGGRSDPMKWMVARSRWDTLWQELLGSQHVDFIKVDFDPGHKRWLQHLLVGWSNFFQHRAFSIMSLEFDERDYWEHLPQFLAYLRTLEYYAFLKWPCTPKKYDGGFQSTAYAPLTDPLMGPPGIPPRISAGRDPHDILIVDARQPRLLRMLVRLGNADCGTTFPLPVSHCR